MKLWEDSHDLFLAGAFVLFLSLLQQELLFLGIIWMLSEKSHFWVCQLGLGLSIGRCYDSSLVTWKTHLPLQDSSIELTNCPVSIAIGVNQAYVRCLMNTFLKLQHRTARHSDDACNPSIWEQETGLAQRLISSAQQAQDQPELYRIQTQEKKIYGKDFLAQCIFFTLSYLMLFENRIQYSASVL